MSIIINADGSPAVPNNDRPPEEKTAIAPSGDISIPYPAWLAIQDRLRKCDLFVLAIATLARERPDCVLKVNTGKMAQTEREAYGIDFKQSEKGDFMLFTARRPVKLEEN